MSNKENSKKSPFTKAELRVVDLLARGFSEKEIADKLNISYNTVSNHTRNIRERHGLTKNSEVLLLYIAYLNNKSFSLANIRDLGLSTILILLNVCDYIHFHTSNVVS